MTLYIQRPVCDANSCPKWTPWRAPQEEEAENVRKTEEYQEAVKSREQEQEEQEVKETEVEEEEAVRHLPGGGWRLRRRT